MSYKALTRYTGNGTQTTYTIDFTYRSTADVVVKINGVLQTITTHYSFPSTSTISFVTAPVATSAIVIRRSTNQSARLVDYTAGSVLKESDLDTDSIQAFNMSQEAIDIAEDGIAISDSTNQFDATSLIVKNVADPTSAQDAATKNYIENTWLTPTDKATITTVNSNLTSINAVNNNSTNINTVATNITDIQNAEENATLAQNYALKVDGSVESGKYSSKAWAVGGTGVTTTAGSGAAQEWATNTTSQVNQNEYSAKEYAVGTQAGQSEGSAKQWAIGGSNFSTSTVVAGGLYSAKYYAEQAAASKTEFSNVYHGVASTDPTQDPDGSALEAGDLYFNSSSSALKYYDGSTWTAIEATDTSGFASNGFSIAMSIAL